GGSGDGGGRRGPCARQGARRPAGLSRDARADRRLSSQRARRTPSAGAVPRGRGGGERDGGDPRVARSGGHRERARMNVLVTGATGDVGGYVTTRLLADGAAVRVLCRSGSDRLPREVEVAGGDLPAPQTLERAVAGMDAVVHCAAHLGGGGRALHAQVNAAGTRALLAAAERAGVGRLVHLSTVAVYGRKDDGQVVRAADGYDPFPEL